MKALLALVAAMTAILSSCAQSRMSAAQELTGGNSFRGKDLLTYYGCASCHTIAGVDGADGLVGPPLTGISRRVYIGGVLPNNPSNMIRWLRNPRAVDPLTAMPNMNITDRDARDIATYLLTLR